MKPNVMYVKVEGRVYLDGRDLLSCLYSYLTQDALANGVSEDKVAVVKVLEDLVGKAYSKCDGDDCDGTYCVTHKEKV